MRVALLVLAALSLLLAGCGPTVGCVCEDLADARCIESDEGFTRPEELCEDQGDDLEDRAEDLGCDGQFDDYLDCIDARLCDWRDGCQTQRDRVDNCISSRQGF